jgi:predicted RecB family nuclease
MRKLAISDETGSYITAATFAAYLKCPTKSYLTAHGENGVDSYFDEIRERIAVAYKTSANQRAKLRDAEPIDLAQVSQKQAHDVVTFLVDCEHTIIACDQRMSLGTALRTNSKLSPEYVSALYSAWDTSDEADSLLVCFGALAIGQATGGKVLVTGKVIHGEAYRIKTIRIVDHFEKTLRIVEAIDSLCKASEAPGPVLNKHCPFCTFQIRCRSIAISRDDLSLLGAMTARERVKYEEKGISTITQLSYGYRPRRRRRLKATTLSSRPPAKHDHKLKALAIKKGCIHVVGSPSLSIEGTAVFIDVEGIPDRDFYYLIGLRYDTRDSPVEHSFWANGRDGECEIWAKCLGALKKIDKPQLIHYGAYEARFLKLMRTRWKVPASTPNSSIGSSMARSTFLPLCMVEFIFQPTRMV